MADDDVPADDSSNPFKGTPMEQFFAQMSGGQLDLNQLMSQMQRMFTPHEGTVNFELAKDTARQALAAGGADPSPLSTQVSAVDDAVRLAENWLDRATTLPAGATRSAAWSKAEWIENSMATWQVLVEPIAAHVVSAMGEALPEEARTMAGPLIGMLTQAGGAMFGQQIGQGVASLAGEVLSSTDIGLPVGPSGVAALVPANIAALAGALEQTPTDVTLYVALRECAHLRLFSHAPWLRGAIVAAVEDFGRGTTIDLSAIESSMRDLDPSRPEAIQEAMAGGLFEPATTPAQQAAKDRLELLLALVEGWVDHIVGAATAETMPTAPALAEAMRRRRATGGPAEETFASLVGLELRPRRLRDASNLWAALHSQAGDRARDDVWSHPDLIPTSADLDDPLAFLDRINGVTADGDDFDAALNRLLDENDE